MPVFLFQNYLAEIYFRLKYFNCTDSQIIIFVWWTVIATVFKN